MATVHNPAEAILLGRVYKAPDLETHVRLIQVDGLEAVEFRDYIPSLEEYGRGYWLPNEPDTLAHLLEALNDVSIRSRVRTLR